MQIRITDAAGQPVELIAFAEPEPGQPLWKHTDVDGDRLVVFPAQIPDVGPGVQLMTDRAGSSVPLDQIPFLIAALQQAATIATTEA